MLYATMDFSATRKGVEMGKTFLIFLHIGFVMMWLAGLFYLPTLFGAAAATRDQTIHTRAQAMGDMLYFGIVSTSAVLAVVFGIALTLYGIDGGWLPVKLVFVLFLVMFHLYCGHLFWQIVHGVSRHSPRYFHLLTGVPLLIMVPPILLVVAKPF